MSKLRQLITAKTRRRTLSGAAQSAGAVGNWEGRSSVTAGNGNNREDHHSGHRSEKLPVENSETSAQTGWHSERAFGAKQDDGSITGKRRSRVVSGGEERAGANLIGFDGTDLDKWRSRVERGDGTDLVGSLASSPVERSMGTISSDSGKARSNRQVAQIADARRTTSDAAASYEESRQEGTVSGVPFQDRQPFSATSGSRLSFSLTVKDSLFARSNRPIDTAEADAISSYQALKSRIHDRLIESLDIDALMELQDYEHLEDAIEDTIHLLLDAERLPLSAVEREQVAKDVLYETLGLGPLEPLLGDPLVNDILVNGPSSVWIDRNGVLMETKVHFKDNNHLLHVINRIVSRVGRRVDESSPIVDARLPDGSRVNAIIPPLSMEGPCLSIRRFRPVPFSFQDLIDQGALTAEMAEFLILAVQARLNILISGGTSAGKTTLLNVLSGYISDRERIVTIEDTAELRLQQRHVIRLESRPANIEGQGAITQRELVKNALRMRPDRIVVGEVRGAEALDMLQAMNTGHEGSLTTVHSNSPRDAMSRLETLVLLSGVELSQRSIREQIGSAFDLVVQIKRLTDGPRKVVSITEVTGLQEGVISMQEIFRYKADGTISSGKHAPCGIRPLCERKIVEAGLTLPAYLLDGSGTGYLDGPETRQCDGFETRQCDVSETQRRDVYETRHLDGSETCRPGGSAIGHGEEAVLAEQD